MNQRFHNLTAVCVLFQLLTNDNLCECLTERAVVGLSKADNTTVYFTNAVETLSGYTRPATTRVRDRAFSAPHHEENTNGGLPGPLRRRWRWVSPETERKIEAAWGPKGSTQCQRCSKDSLSHRSLRLHVDANFQFTFCPCEHHDVYPYPVIRHRAAGCFPGGKLRCGC